MNEQLSVLNSNVRGLNDGAKRASVRAFIERTGSSIVCIQETKLSTFCDADRVEIAGPRYDGHAVLHAEGTRGGVLMMWKSDIFSSKTRGTRTTSALIADG